MRQIRYLTMAPLLALLACQSPEGYIDEQRAMAGEKITSIKTWAEKIDKFDKSKKKKKLNWPGPPPVFGKQTLANGQMLTLTDIKKAGSDFETTDTLFSSGWYHNVTTLLKNGRYVPNKYHPEGLQPPEVNSLLKGYFNRINKMRYLALAQKQKRKRSTIKGDRFSKGLYQARVYFFDLAENTYLGSFRVRAENSNRVSHSGSVLSNSEAINADLFQRAREAIARQLRQQVKGASLGDLYKL